MCPASKWNDVHTALLLPSFVVEPILLFGPVLRAPARSRIHSNTSQIVAMHAGSFQTRIVERFRSCRDAHQGGAGNVRPVFDTHPLVFVEVVHFARDLDLKTLRIEPRDPADSADPGAS